MLNITKNKIYLCSSLIFLNFGCGTKEKNNRKIDKTENISPDPKKPNNSDASTNPNGTEQPNNPTKPPQNPGPSREPTIPNTIDQNAIFKIVSESEIVKYKWKNRGKAPIGYLKGLALTYAKNFCKLENNDKFALEMAKPSTGDTNKDVIAHYEKQFNDIGITLSNDNHETLKQLFTLQIGLGMRESSGRFCAGRDAAANNTSAETAEAGLFQTSYNARNLNKLILPEFFKLSRTNPDELQSVFKEGTSCATISGNHGTRDGVVFQQLSKANPVFATEFTGIAMRNGRKHWGPLNRHEAEVKLEAYAMLSKIQDLLETTNPCD